MISRFSLACQAIILFLVTLTTGAQAQTPAVSGQFDFYVLSLSWSPSYCEATGDKRKDTQCARPFGFVLHGLWPQLETSYPSDCKSSVGRLPDSLIKAQLDIFPAPGLVVHEWTKHGTCSGLDPAAYFEAARKAYAGVNIPAAYAHIDKPQFADIKQMATDFISANKGLEASAISVVCNRQHFDEIRICLNKDLKTYHPCPTVVAGSCKQAKSYMPAIRTGN